MTKGLYQGFYKYNNQRIQNNLGRDQTFFDIDIHETEGNKFYVTVQEEIEGQPGDGLITGEISKRKISFVKQMSIAASITPDGQRRMYNARHSKIYYDGVDDGEKFRGTWKIKFGFIFVGLLPIPILPTNGTWEMKKKVGY